ncbi:MAG: Na+-dependent transporter [Alphaproteobacteria bacterium]
MLLPALSFLGRHGTRVLAAGILTGLALPDLAHALKPLLTALVMATMTGALLRVEWPDIARQIRAWPRVAAATLWLIVAAPVLVALVCRLLPLPDGLVAAMVLSAAGPCVMAAPAIALLLGLDAALSLVVMVTAHLLVPATMPPLAAALVGVTLDIGIGELAARLALIVLGAAAAAEAIRRIVGRARIRRAGEAINGVNMVMLVLFAIAIMDGVTAAAIAEPARVALYFAAAIVFNAALQAAGWLVFRRAGAPAALAVGLMTGNRNMGLVWAALGPETPFAIALYFAVAQLPMYLFPALQSWLFRRMPAFRSATGRR